mmetsp:Transcript_12701/g.23811  ORF Transcript_12701/g.23811 Transcript_12701/m.23811 type:complete len:624 (+) Transcript_12701:83-1954(+)|eukprot:CAMPEP_0176484000 /NCGR_PEP_ID=MMETSP0200_2-20121128/4218_1 /TAXON_ID=947934 /ORGANISM="Chaetoceros sp., Strain GSL56" /LENGTH=623 /DNA_ID=CAMNT_0017880439 /DNA_START=82 /DNA_END=1953 /DNA_ORIENTATION=+
MNLVGPFIALFAVKGTQKSGKVLKKQSDLSNLHNSRMRWAVETDAVVLIDLENVRGKSDFGLSHGELLKRTILWSKANNLQDKVTFFVDHGSIHTAYYLPDGGLSMVFAGPRMKADDVLARDIAFFERNAIVITADNELMSRCRNAMLNSRADIEVQFIQPIKFICDLENIVKKTVTIEGVIDSPMTTTEGQSECLDNNNQDDANVLPPELVQKIDEEIKLRGAMYETDIQMREKSNMSTPKKRRKLEKRARMLCERLALKGGQSLDHLTTLNGVTEYDRNFQDEVLKQWEKLRQTATRREMTGDRILLAEYFRRKIESISLEQNHEAPDSAKSSSHSLRYAQYIQNMSGNNVATCMGSGGIQQSSRSDGFDHSKASDNRPLRLVVISDTHGFEESLTPDGGMLPEGDILLHLGDFAIDNSLKKKAKALENFDAWLARQPHRTKIVLRGNHDPFSVPFPQSGANYFCKPKSIAIDGKITIILVPYSSPRNLSSSWRNLPMFCDILASHSPPHRILDKCYNGANAGCSSLRGKVERMIAGPPHLWLCGHIHEGRGVENVAFGLTSRETMVVNVSNANDGRATRIQYDPVVLDIDTNGNINVVQGQGIQSKSSEQEQKSAIVAVQ